MPNLFVLSGPNGAGKSTIAEKLLTGDRRVAAFVNADDIAAEIGGTPGPITDIKASRIMLERLDALVAQTADLAFETTLASRSLLPRIVAMREAGYLFHLIYLWLPSADMAVRRVAMRVEGGGHDIPDSVIRRRYERSLVNFFNRYRPVADSWLMLDNTGVPYPKAIAWRNEGGPLQIVRDGPWEQLRRQYEPIHSDKAVSAPKSKRGLDVDEVIAAATQAVHEALARHKARGESVVIWRDGHIVTLRPEEINI